MTLTPEQREKYWAAYGSVNRPLPLAHSAGLEAVALAAQRDIVLAMIADLDAKQITFTSARRQIPITFSQDDVPIQTIASYIRTYLPAAPPPQEAQ